MSELLLHQVPRERFDHAVTRMRYDAAFRAMVRTYAVLMADGRYSADDLRSAVAVAEFQMQAEAWGRVGL